MSESGSVLCGLGGVDRWSEAPDDFHLTSWKPPGLTYADVLDAHWFAQWQLVFRDDAGKGLRLFGSPVTFVAQE
ncbi:hypothetical protein [Tahibacter sp.]|uniref:hypothetical protein n=1 Tax=Tahibacter sp. TaxID=2056211 RepID=UPI0028C43FFF|nr:hypothetical protein [Tahibacter sp.]